MYVVLVEDEDTLEVYGPFANRNQAEKFRRENSVPWDRSASLSVKDPSTAGVRKPF